MEFAGYLQCNRHLTGAWNMTGKQHTFHAQATACMVSVTSCSVDWGTVIYSTIPQYLKDILPILCIGSVYICGTSTMYSCFSIWSDTNMNTNSKMSTVKEMFFWSNASDRIQYNGRIRIETQVHITNSIWNHKKLRECNLATGSVVHLLIGENPSCLQTTIASVSSQSYPQTLPQYPLWHVCTVPLFCVSPFTKCVSVLLHSGSGLEIMHLIGCICYDTYNIILCCHIKKNCIGVSCTTLLLQLPLTTETSHTSIFKVRTVMIVNSSMQALWKTAFTACTLDLIQ